MNKADEFRRKFAFRSSEAAPKQAQAPASNDEYLRTLARMVARSLQDVAAPANVFALLDRLSMEVDELLPVIRWMEEQGYIEVTARPRTGDWQLKSTAKASEIV